MKMPIRLLSICLLAAVTLTSIPVLARPRLRAPFQEEMSTPVAAPPSPAESWTLSTT